MTSFQLSVSPNRRAAGRFVFSVRRELQKALVESGISQSHVARAIGVHRSVISRELNGRSDMTLGRVAEIANVLGRVPTFSLPDASQGDASQTNGPDSSLRLSASFSSVSTIEINVQTIGAAVANIVVVSDEKPRVTANG